MGLKEDQEILLFDRKRHGKSNEAVTDSSTVVWLHFRIATRLVAPIYR